MKTLTTILAATDFSELSRLAIRRAAQLGQEHGAALELLHVVQGLPPEEAFPLIQALEAARKEVADESLANVPAGLNCRCQVETGKDFVAIIRRARQLPADLIVIGAHGGHYLKDYVVGTMAEKLARKAGIPLLVVKQPPQKPYRRILVATDFSSASRQAMEIAMTIAPQADIDLLHVYGFWGEGRLSLAGAGTDLLDQYRQQAKHSSLALLQEWMEGCDFGEHRVIEYLRQGHPASVIAQVAAERQADLVVLGTAGRSGLPYILLGSVSEQALRTIPCDTLMVRPREFHFELP